MSVDEVGNEEAIPPGDEATTVYVGGRYELEVETGTVTKYYYFGGQRVAMRQDGVVYYLHGDHLGSTSLTTDAGGAVVARQLYHPYGTVRYSQGTLPTDFGFTGQRDVPGTGLVFMHARYYHAGLGRFVSADTIVPEAGEPQAFNRYAYVLGNPLKYVDPTGHLSEDEIMGLFGLDPKVNTWDDVLAHFEESGDLEGQWGYLGVLRDFELGCHVSAWQDGEFLGGTLYWTDGYSANDLQALGKEPATMYSIYNMAEGGQPDHEVYYYATRKYYRIKLDLSKVDWVDAGVDVFGFIGDRVKLLGHPGAAVYVLSEFAEGAHTIVTAGSSAHEFTDAFRGLGETGNAMDVLTSDIGLGALEGGVDALRLVPEAGTYFNVLSLATNLSEAVSISP